MSETRYRVLLLAGIVCCSLVLLQMTDTSVAFAAAEDYDKMLDGFGDKNSGVASLGDTLKTFGKGFYEVGSKLVVIMTATAACMYAFGVEDGKKSVWGALLGIGLAFNAAPILWALFGTGDATAGLFTFVDPEPEHSTFSWTLTKGEGSSQISTFWNLTGDFFRFYRSDVIVPACARLVPYACRICLVLTCIDVSVQLGLKLVEGDKVKFMVSKFLACGMYLFLIANWVSYGNDMKGGLHLMDRLAMGMRGLGAAAAGGKMGAVIGGDNIFAACIEIASAYFGAIKDADTVMMIFLGLVGLFVCFMLLMICMEMIMAFFEFYTMSLLTIPLLAFGVLPQLKFLADSAIKAMFNLSIKIMCIAFLTGVIATTINDYVKEIVSVNQNASASSMWQFVSNFATDVSNSISLCVIVGMMYILVKKMPQLIQGLLQGNPSLSSGDMMGTMTGAMNGVGNAAGRVSAAMGGGSGGGGEAGGGDEGGGGPGGGGGSGGGGSAASSVKGTMSQLKNNAGAIAKAVTTGGAGAVAMAAGKMMKDAVKNKANAAQKSATNAKNAVQHAAQNPGETAKKAAVGGLGLAAKGGMGVLKGGAKLVAGTAKAAGRYALRNAPGAKGYWDGKKMYKNDKDDTTFDSTKRKNEAQQRHNDLSEKREMMGSMVEAVGGKEARQKFEQDFDKKNQFQPSPPPPPPNPIVQAALDHNKKNNPDE